MKRKIVLTMAAFALSASLLAGCGSGGSLNLSDIISGQSDDGEARRSRDNDKTSGDTSDSSGSDEDADKLKEEEEKKAEEDKKKAEEEKKKQEEEEKKAEEERLKEEILKHRNGYLDKQGIVISPQGVEAVYETMTKDDVLITCTIKEPTVTETTEGCDDGMKKVIFHSYLDFGSSRGWKSWSSVFDRYTGTSFEFDTSSTTHTAGAGMTVKDGFVTIVDGDNSYDVSVEFAGELDNNNVLDRYITVTCPEDYDGCVFYIGYSSNVQAEELKKFDLANKLYMDCELPYNEAYCGHKYYYYTLTND